MSSEMMTARLNLKPKFFFMSCHCAEEMFLGWRRMCELSKDSGSCQEDEGPLGGGSGCWGYGP